MGGMHWAGRCGRVDVGGSMEAKAFGVNGNVDAPFPPDHAGLFETTLLAGFHPHTVDMTLLPPAFPSEAGETHYGPQRHDPAPNLHGNFGPSPRDFDPARAPELRRVMAEWLASSVSPV